jgi:hypothetical protein
MEYQTLNTFKPLDLSDLTKQVDAFVATVNEQKSVTPISETKVATKPEPKSKRLTYSLTGFGIGLGIGIGYSVYKKFGSKKIVISALIGGLVGTSVFLGGAMLKEN